MLGIPIKTDRITKEKTALKYACTLSEMKLNDSFPEYIDFISDEDVIVRQAVRYEWKPIKCDHCNMIGHEEAECRRKSSWKEWRVVIKGQGDEDNREERNQTQQVQRDKEEFITPRRVSSRTVVQQQEDQIARHNPFQALMEEEITRMINEEIRETEQGRAPNG